MNDKRIQRALNWMEKEIKKDEMEVNLNKKKLIEEIKSIDRETMFKKQEKPKMGFFEKISIIFGYGKKR
jgi:hypothetical protein